MAFHAGDTNHKWLVHASVDGEALGVFDSMSGGETDSEEIRHHSGGMAPEEAKGGPGTVSLVTVTRQYRQGRDGQLEHRLRGRVGRVRMRVVKQALDQDRHPVGNPIVYVGVFKRINGAEPDSDSGDFATIELEMTPDESVG